MKRHNLTRSAAGLLLAMIVTAGATGCALLELAYGPHPRPGKQIKVDQLNLPAMGTQYASAGSLYPTDYVSPFADDKARRKGDVILVHVLQKNKGAKNAKTNTKRDSAITANIKYAMGYEDTINKLNEYVQNNPTARQGTATWNPPNLVDAQSSNQFNGEGATERNDTLEATVSAIVTDVLENGNLVIYGHQTVTVNNEASVLTVQGIVRPSDLGEGNTILSSRIADARIEFRGSGVIDDKQHPGWGMRLFDWAWPF